MMLSARSILVTHTGALGDHVMIWPLLRALLRAGKAVTLACEVSKGALAAEHLSGLVVVSIDAPAFRALWHEDEVSGMGAERFDEILCFHVGADDLAGRRWTANARRVFGVLDVRHVGPPGSSSRVALWDEIDVKGLGCVETRTSLDGPIVLHVGAGSREKRWSMSRWVELQGQLRAVGLPVRVIAGEVEREKLCMDDRLLFDQLSGEYVEGYARLTEMLRSARAVIAADTGPAHLAAQMGLPTVALFGPTDPVVWSPVGPQVCVLAPPALCAMDWLSSERVMSGLMKVLSDGLRNDVAG